MRVNDIGKPKPDTRMDDPKFREIVRTCLTDVGADLTMGNFRKYDGIINWKQYAHNILKPTLPARVKILTRGHPTGHTTVVDLPGETRAEAITHLDTELYEFIEWW